MILIIGVNGSGKTTTIGKLARRLQGEGQKVMLAAGDTFRAAAIEQLRSGASATTCRSIAQSAGADPAAVVFDALQSAQARGIGRPDRRHRGPPAHAVAPDGGAREDRARAEAPGRDAPHEVLLVLDAGLGQNALRQAEQFQEAIGVTGIAMTKLDGTAKGGIVLAIAARFGLPIRYVGVGEQAEDFGIFDARATWTDC